MAWSSPIDGPVNPWSVACRLAPSMWQTDTDGGGVLHCAQASGVVFQRPEALSLNGWTVEGVYRFAGDGI